MSSRKRQSKKFSPRKGVPKKEKIEKVVSPKWEDPGSTETERLCAEISESLKNGDFNPMMRQMAMVAMGDCVGLGYMTRQEFLQEADYDPETGKCIQLSGQMLAMKLIPPRIRAKMMSDLAPFFMSKKKELDTTGQAGGKPPEVIFYIPENGRDVKR